MQTEWLKDMIAMARDPLAAWLLDQMEAKIGIFRESHVSADQIATLIEIEGSRNWKGVAGSTPQKITSTLINLGIKKELVWAPEVCGYRSKFKLREKSEVIPQRKFERDEVVNNIYQLNDKRNQVKQTNQTVAPSWL